MFDIENAFQIKEYLYSPSYKFDQGLTNTITTLIMLKIVKVACFQILKGIGLPVYFHFIFIIPLHTIKKSANRFFC